MTNARTANLQQAYLMGAFSVPCLLVYAAAQTSVALVVAPANPDMKLVLEPYLLILGLILHVQWRRVGHLFLAEGLSRPVWVLTADCLSFTITFWAMGVLVLAFLEEARLL